MNDDFLSYKIKKWVCAYGVPIYYNTTPIYMLNVTTFTLIYRNNFVYNNNQMYLKLLKFKKFSLKKKRKSMQQEINLVLKI